MFTIPGPVILDLNTQRDLLATDGVAPVFQSEKLFDPLKRLFQFANRASIPVISTRLHHSPVPGQRGNGRIVCHPGTPGYDKMPFTNLRRRTEWPLDCGTNLPVEGFRNTQQFVFDLPNLNLFECARLDRLLSESTADLFLIVGAPVEWTIRTAVLGLLARRHKVAMVSDCIGMWDPYEGDMALRQIESKNIEWLSAEQVAERYSTPTTPHSTRATRAKARAVPTPPPAAKPRSSIRAAASKKRGDFRI